MIKNTYSFPYNLKILFKLFLFYFFANLLLLINFEGIYWDDWSLFRHTFENILSQFSQNSGNAGYCIAKLHDVLLSIHDGVALYRLTTFVLLFLSGLFVYAILKTIKELSNQDIFFLTLFFLIVPVYDAKIALINFPTTFFLFVFFLSFFFVSIYTTHKILFFRILSLPLFFLSFLTNSLLVFFAIVLLYLFYHHSHTGLYDNYRSIIKTFIVKYFDFLTLPILFFVIKSIYFAPSNLYKGYNAISFKGLLVAPILSIKAFYTSFIVVINESISLIGILWFILFVYLLYTRFNRNKIRNDEKNISNSYQLLFLFLGVIFFFLGVFPYCVVGKLPENDDWSSRFQLLVPLGFSFIIYFGILIFSRKFQFDPHLQKALLFAFVFIFMIKNLYQDYRYNIDWFYTVSIEQNFKDSELIRDHSTFIVTTTLKNELVNNRRIRYYEYNGMLRHAFQNDSRLMVTSKEQLTNIEKVKSFQQYNFSSWQYDAPIYLSIIPNPEYELKRAKIIKLFYYRLFNKEKFYMETKKLILLNVIKG